MILLDIPLDGMHETYVRSRQGNLRCFPHCFNGTHYEKSICGAPLKVTLSEINNFSKNDRVLGKFRNIKHQVSIDSLFESLKTNFDEFHTAIHVSSSNDGEHFVFNSKRVWNCILPDKIMNMDRFVFTIFYLTSNRVESVVDTPSFGITPIWRVNNKKREILNTQGQQYQSQSTNVPVLLEKVPPSSSVAIQKPILSSNTNMPPHVEQLHSSNSFSNFNQNPVPHHPLQQMLAQNYPRLQSSQTFTRQNPLTPAFFSLPSSNFTSGNSHFNSSFVLPSNSVQKPQDGSREEKKVKKMRGNEKKQPSSEDSSE
jgi:hypothetical protein